ncbi:integrase catalytic domain-containing protein [Nephila pilipes]|uniref:Integrase catalytic domain-containing protein n=1 Tax=Nephila pilipes TaxID=299642 RepID=A0A8X6QQ05_NEPPI|nr:integrase catalytic domain-containing protein [Nephila pilipes]
MEEAERASEAAFRAVVYCESQTPAGDFVIKIIVNKSRVAPLKKITLTRLGLSFAVLLVKLMQRMQKALRLEVSKTYYWGDSMIVLSWLKKQSSQLKTFVANRVAKIQNISGDEQWSLLLLVDNLAYFIIRGVNPSKMLENQLW